MAVVLPFVYQAAVGIAISYAAGKLLEEDVDTPIVDHGPSPTVERGTPITLLIGRDRLGPIYTWYGSRFSDDEDLDGGKGSGGSSGEQTVWYEEGWHVLCVGPARRLWEIQENGKTIYVGPMDPASTPSGTTVDLGDGSSFVIYWGEADQPENTVLGAPGKLTEAGHSSRHPYLCYVHWVFKRLGTSPIWPRITYDTEVWPFDTKLAATASWFPATRTLVGPVQDIEQTQDGTAGVGYIEFLDNDNSFKPSGWARVEGNTVADGDYRVDSVVKNLIAGDMQRRIIMGQTMVGLTDFVGTIQAYQDEDDDGPNGAHALYQLLFAPAPHGRGLDPEGWDIASLEKVGVTCYQEGLRNHVTAEGDKTFKSCIADLMQDIGAMLVRDSRTGKLGFRLIRESTEVAVLQDVHLCGDPPEVQNVVESRQPASRKSFTFNDRLRNFLEYPIIIGDDGVATLDQSYGRERIPMTTVRDLTTAWQVAKRRNQESYSGDMPVVARSKNEACKLEPGQQVTIPELDQVMLVMDSERRDFRSGEVEVSLVPNYYGVPASNAVIYSGGGEAGEIEENGQDLEVVPFEVPQRLNGTGSMRVGVARIRSAPTVSKTKVHLSDDDVSFFLLGSDTSIHTGGKLDAAMLASGPSLIDSGPTFVAEGSDIEGALDLSAASSEFEWQSGRQVAIIGDGTGYELLFVRWIESLGGGQYRLREVIRHRFGTPKTAWPSGTPVVIFDRDQVRQFTDLVLVPDDDYFFKSQPVGPSPVPLDDITSFELDAYGEGVRPRRVTCLYGGDSAGRQSNCFSFPNSVFIRWGYTAAPGPSNACPAELPAGEPVFARPPCDGTLRIRITDPHNGDALVRQVDLPLDQNGFYEYTQALIKTDFGLGVGFTPSTTNRLNVWDDAPSPAVTAPRGSLVAGTETPGTIAYVLGGFANATILLVTLAGVPGQTPWPNDNANAVIKFLGPGALGSRARCNMARVDSTNTVVESGPLTAFQNILATDTILTFAPTPPVGGWGTTGPAVLSTDRFELNVLVNNQSGLTLSSSIVTGDGSSYVELPMFLSAVDFDVEVSVVKGSHQSSLREVSILNMGGTTT